MILHDLPRGKRPRMLHRHGLGGMISLHNGVARPSKGIEGLSGHGEVSKRILDGRSELGLMVAPLV